MLPTAAVSGYYFSHPDSAYYGIGRIERDQVVDYAARCGTDVETVERRLASNLAYDPDADKKAATEAAAANATAAANAAVTANATP
jgi:5-methyltetrahydrofolate--homocysteine methyltransferase